MISNLWRKALLLVGVAFISIGVILLTHLTPRPADIDLLKPPLVLKGPVPRKGEWGPPPCKVQLPPADRNVVLNESFTLDMHIGDDYCETEISIYGPGFDAEPKEKKFRFEPPQDAAQHDFSFVLLPKQTGHQAITADYAGGQYKLWYTVRSYKYLPPWLTAWSGPITSAMGGVLTVPWWLEFLKRRRKDQEEKKKDTKIIITP